MPEDLIVTVVEPVSSEEMVADRARRWDPQLDRKAIEGARDMILRGASIPAACHAFGMRPSRLRPEVGMLFARAAAKARSVVEERLFEHASKPAGEGDWRAAQAFLQGHPHSKGDWGPQLDVRRLDDATLLRLISEFEGGEVPATIDAQFKREGEGDPGDGGDEEA